MADDVLTDRRGQILLLSVAAVALFLDGLDGTIVNVVLPDMAKDFGTDTSATSWVVTAYYVMMAGLILIFGKVCDAGALKRVFTLGLVVFAVGSLACGLSGTLSVMLVSRVVQGIGAAMLASSAFMVGIRYLPKSMSGFVLSVSVLGIAVGSAAGPLLGAVLAEFSSWHMVFLINVPIAAVAAVVAVRVVPSDAGFSGRGFDLSGAALLFVALVCGLYVLESSPSHGFDTVSIACTAVFLVCISLFVLNERRATDPVIKFRLFRSRGLLSAMALLTIVNMCYLGCLYLLPYYLSTVMGLGPLETGLYSRFTVCTRPPSVCWESCAPDSVQPDLGSYFHTLGEELLGMHLALLESPTRVNFTPAQWERHTAFFSRLLAETHAEGRDTLLGIIFRHGLLAMRLAALLTAFRKWDGFRHSPEYTCTDADFRSALLITQTVLEHSLLLCTSLPDSDRPMPALRKTHLLEQVLAVLPRKFSYTEFVETAMTSDISLSTAKRMLQRAQKAQLIVKQKDGYRKKRLSRQTSGLSDPEPRKRTPKSPKTAGKTIKKSDNSVNPEAYEKD